MNRINRVNSKRYGFTILDNFQFNEQEMMNA